MTDPESYIRSLSDSVPLREPVLRSAINHLSLPHGSTGLDIGCGIGDPTLLLAEAVGPYGHITGLDIEPKRLDHAQRTVEAAGLAARILFRQGDMYHLPFENDSFDWAWSVDCVGYPGGELLPALQEISRVVRPGGIVAVLAWSSQQILPGHSLLEARLNATCSAYTPFLRGRAPEAHYMRALRWFSEAGLVGAAPRTFVGEVWAPLSPGIRRALISLFEMLWGEPQPDVSAEDRRQYERLCLPSSPDFILNLSDYYAFFTYTMFSARIPQ
jgi:demethylmenaquinone methyltransferase/2-methoxy-6-polyprenyl-1,4-benzoquinol methylase